MDDYNVNVLSEAKNEYSSRLVTILTPLITEGIRSIFNEACKLCEDNNEEEKYLMTFQNFLSRVPKWNTTIIEEEKNRILQSSGCSYLEDLIICVHITQLKILTSIRVSQKQKKIDIDIPKLDTFIHKCYIHFARKLYQNVYLFEKDLLPLDYQKNNREIELICQECILQVTRDSMPVEKILRAYIDKTVDEEVIEETIEKTVEENVAKQMEDELSKQNNENGSETTSQEATVTKNDVEINTVEKPELNKTEKQNTETTSETPVTKEAKSQNINLIIETPKAEVTSNVGAKEAVKETVDTLVNSVSASATIASTKSVNDTSSTEKTKEVGSQSTTSKLSFNDNDSVLDMGTNKKTEVNAPKTIERLEQISKEQNEKRKLEEAEEDDDEDSIKIMGDTSIQLDTLDIHNLDKEVKLEPNIILNDIEVLT
tara:strand:+ start:12390 stop:13673 length:1284 start_codon:yes stop_codon:yes gene_type:complete